MINTTTSFIEFFTDCDGFVKGATDVDLRMIHANLAPTPKGANHA